MQFGSAMHLALKAYFDGVRAGRPPDEATVIACFLDELSKTKIDEPLQRALYEKDGRDQLSALLRSELGRSRGEILETEKRFRVEIGGAQVTGRFDRIDQLPSGEVEIVDYKTGKPKTQDDADDSLQLSDLRPGGAQPGTHAGSAGLYQSAERNRRGGAALAATASGSGEQGRGGGRQDCRRRV